MDRSWKTSGGHGWVNPYDRRVWDYNLGIAEAAAKAGFDEIMLDYMRFPSDGDTASAVYPGRTSVPRGELIADFAAYAQRRLAPQGVRISTALFGLSATRDLRIGQVPAWISHHVDHVSPMAYPSLYGGGELGSRARRRAGRDRVPNPGRFPRAASRKSRTADPLDPGLEPPGEVLRQAAASRSRQPACKERRAILLWNASGMYTKRPRSADPSSADIPLGGEPLASQPAPSRS